MSQPARDRDEVSPERPWYQTSIRELLLVTTLAAMMLSFLKTVGFRNLVVVVGTLFPFALDFLAVCLRFRQQCKEYGIWDPPLCGSAEEGELPATEAFERRQRLRAKREAFLRLVSQFVGRTGLYRQGDTVCLVRVERAVGSIDRLRARLRAVPGVRLSGKLMAGEEETRLVYWEEACPFGPRWELAPTWAYFDFSDDAWEASGPSNWSLAFSEDLVRRFLARDASWLAKYADFFL